MRCGGGREVRGREGGVGEEEWRDEEGEVHLRQQWQEHCVV